MLIHLGNHGLWTCLAITVGAAENSVQFVIKTKLPFTKKETLVASLVIPMGLSNPATAKLNLLPMCPTVCLMSALWMATKRLSVRVSRPMLWPVRTPAFKFSLGEANLSAVSDCIS